MRTSLRCASATTLALSLTACATSDRWLPAPSATAEEMPRTQAYDGARRARDEIGIVYATDAGPRYPATYLCSVDGVDLRRSSGLSSHCPAVVYLLPGVHRIGWRHRSFASIGHGEMSLKVEPGGLYQVNPSVTIDGDHGIASILTMAPGMTLTWRNLAPSRSGHPDEAVPYAAN